VYPAVIHTGTQKHASWKRSFRRGALVQFRGDRCFGKNHLLRSDNHHPLIIVKKHRDDWINFTGVIIGKHKLDDLVSAYREVLEVNYNIDNFIVFSMLVYDPEHNESRVCVVVTKMLTWVTVLSGKHVK